MKQNVRVASVQPLSGYEVRFSFTDGEVRVIDLDPYLGHRGVFEELRQDVSLFCSMSVDGGTIAWPNGADLDPDVLYYGLDPRDWSEDASPKVVDVEFLDDKKVRYTYDDGATRVVRGRFLPDRMEVSA